MDRIHKRVQVFLHICNTTSLEDVEIVALAEFIEIQRQVERGEWITNPPPGYRCQSQITMGEGGWITVEAR